MFSQFGVHRVNAIEEFFDLGAALAVGGRPAGDEVALVTVSGGVGVLMADDAATRGLEVTPLPEATQAKFKELVPYAGVNNPLDVTGQIINQPDLFAKAMRNSKSKSLTWRRPRTKATAPRSRAWSTRRPSNDATFTLG